MTEVFVEQPLASPGSAKKVKHPLCRLPLLLLEDHVFLKAQFITRCLNRLDFNPTQ